MYSPRFRSGRWTVPAVLLLFGCGQSNKSEGLPEDGEVLKARIAELESQLKALQTESPVVKQRVDAELARALEELSRQREEQLAELRQFQKKVKQLQDDNADLQLQLRRVSKEKQDREELLQLMRRQLMMPRAGPGSGAENTQ
jgi:outer membrane murein-binding lipoprotein Lpp